MVRPVSPRAWAWAASSSGTTLSTLTWSFPLFTRSATASRAGPVGLDEEESRAYPRLARPVGREAVVQRQDRDQRAARTQGAQGAGAVVAADGVENDVDIAHRRREVLLRVVDELIGAQAAQEVMLGPPGGADHIRATGLGDLHREMTDAARRGMDQHPCAGPHLRGVDQGLPGGQCRQRESGAPDVVQVRGKVGEVPRGGGDVLGVGPGGVREARHAEDFVARCEEGDAEADRLDHTGHIEAQDERRLAAGQEPAAWPASSSRSG